MKFKIPKRNMVVDTEKQYPFIYEWAKHTGDAHYRPSEAAAQALLSSCPSDVVYFVRSENKWVRFSQMDKETQAMIKRKSHNPKVLNS